MDKGNNIRFERLFKDVSSDNFHQIFTSDKECKRILSEIKWKNGFVCRHCGWDNFCKGKDDYSRRCTRCKRDESVLADTVFHSCKLNLVEAFEIAFMVCCNPHIAASQISEILSIRHMTCLNFKKKILECKEKQENEQ